MLEGVFSVASYNIVSFDKFLVLLYYKMCHKNIRVLRFVYDVHKT